jgi:hypothetical protein
MMIQVSDGREMTVSCEADGSVLCSDNTRYFRWAYKVVQPELSSLLRETRAAFIAEMKEYPPASGAAPTGMPN